MQTTGRTSESLVEREHEHVLEALEGLYHLSCEILANNRPSLEDAQALSISVTEVRLLLAELVQLETRLQRNDKISAWIADLSERYWDLEGITKEVRNSLSRTGSAAGRG